MTDDQFERIKKGLNFHSEGGVYNLCTLTETALRTIIEDAVKFYEKQQKIDALHIMELQKQKGELTDELTKKSDTNHQLVEQLAKLNERCSELEAQIDKMKRCEICKHYQGESCNYHSNWVKDCKENGMKLFELKEIKEK